MAKYPGAKWRPISRNYTASKTAKNCAILHSTASAKATSMHSWFNTAGANASSHFHVDDAGIVEQYIDTDHVSWANSAANSRSVTIETQGDGTKPWTAKQRAAIVKLLAWITKTHSIPVRQMASSAKSERGIGWHRLGCDGNFPSSGILRGRNQRGTGESWSSARGKVCPGDDRILQMPGIISELLGDTAPSGNVKPAPAKPSGKVWPDVALKVTSTHTTESHNAWVKLMADVGYTDKSLTTAIQKWLKSLGFYKGRIDTDFGALTVRALQSFLVSKGLLPSAAYVDGNRGAVTIRAEINYLNDQRRYY